MSWSPCRQCGADGYIIRIRGAFTCSCPKCGATLAEAPTRTLAIMEYTREYRIRRATP